MHTSGLAPRWASAPGETMTSAMEERGMSRSDVIQWLGLDDVEFERLASGDLAITLSLARRLAEVIGGSTRFWMTREAQYLDDLATVKVDKWSQAFPVSQMASFGWLDKPKTWRERIQACLRFFDVEDVEQWDKRYGRQLEAAYFRTSPSFELEPAATTAWFRAGERAAESIAGRAAYNAAAFGALLPALRRLTRVKEPERFGPELVERCAAVGVLVVIVRAPKGCPAGGAARVFRGQPLIQLSARHLTDDHFWFMFFHEAGHVLLHSLDIMFLDILDSELGDGLEKEASDFAHEWLMGRAAIRPGAVSLRDIVRAAQANEVSPGIIVGQLQHAGQLGPTQFNGLKRRYKWNGVNLETKRRN